MNRRTNPQNAVDDWNARVSVGATVAYSEVRGDPPRTFTTRTSAEVLSGHTAVVWLTGKSCCVAISHCTLIQFHASASARNHTMKAYMLTEQEWTDRCSKRYVERGGCSAENARQLATAAFENRDSDESPEEAADTDMSHWAEDR